MQRQERLLALTMLFPVGRKWALRLLILAGLGIFPAWSETVRPDINFLTAPGRRDSALDAARETLKTRPESPDAHFILGLFSLNGDTSLHHLKIAAQKFTNPELKQEAVFRIAQNRFARGTFDSAASGFQTYLKDFPQGVHYRSARFWLGSSLLRINPAGTQSADSAEAQFILLLKSVDARDSFHVKALTGLGLARLKKNEPESAIETLSMAMDAAPDYEKPGLLLLLSEAYGKLNDTLTQKIHLDRLLKQYAGSLEAALVSESPQLMPSSGSSVSQTQGQSSFALQIAAFTTEANALRALDGFKKMNLDVQVVQSVKDGTAFFLIHTRAFPTRKDAENHGITVLAPREVPYYVIEKN